MVSGSKIDVGSLAYRFRHSWDNILVSGSCRALFGSSTASSVTLAFLACLNAWAKAPHLLPPILCPSVLHSRQVSLFFTGTDFSSPAWTSSSVSVVGVSDDSSSYRLFLTDLASSSSHVRSKTATFIVGDDGAEYACFSRKSHLNLNLGLSFVFPRAAFAHSCTFLSLSIPSIAFFRAPACGSTGGPGQSFDDGRGEPALAPPSPTGTGVSLPCTVTEKVLQLFPSLKPRMLLKIDIISQLSHRRITMWMQYSASHWPVAENLNLAVERMSCELSALSFEYYHETVNGNSAFDEESVTYYMKESEKCDLGAKLCQKYIYNVLDLDEFCTLMVLADLKRFLENISHFLSEDIVNKFQLNDPPSYEDAGDTGEELEVANTENA
ncbi:hypothetical protein NQ318_022539 [Aromia moschata]|uniref:Uncharacterized protein n=1 Tax=Aromia moschata TaxID=1265417 RepID=A0AAV8XLZ3_9CUCU|nr:hypothetical protein NQ318_022539 [Aromia moschata]